MLKNAFLYRVALYELKNCSFPQTKRFSFTENFTNFTQSHFYAQKLLLYVPFFAVLKNFHFHKPNGFLLQKALRTVLKSRLFMCKKPFIRTNLSLLPSKAILFCPPQPIPTALNLLFAKNAAVLLIFTLTPCAVKPERRTDSNHCRRYPAKLQLFAKPVT